MIYNRSKVVAYAKEWAYRRNPKYLDFSELGGDCTNFASQCIFAGSNVMNYTPTYGWYYINSYNRAPAWTGVNELYRFLTTNTGKGPVGKIVGLDEIDDGDIIQLKFRPNSDRSQFAHSPVVVDKGDRTPDTILLAAHSNDADCRQLSTYKYLNLRPIHIIRVNE